MQSPDPGKCRVAYFSMEIALEASMTTYSGGLGVLAGDTLKSAADMHLPLVGVTLIHRKGYFHQRLDPDGTQREQSEEWLIENYLQELPNRITVSLEGRTVILRAWRYWVRGISGYNIPVYFLDTFLEENTREDRELTHYLYGGDKRYRFCQEVVLGIGGVRMLRSLGYGCIQRFHMNEGHSSLLALELMDERAKQSGRAYWTHDDLQPVRELCVFTTHTPVPVGHDQFPLDLVNQVMRRPEILAMKEIFCCEGVLNMTYTALNLSHFVNGVAKRHGEVSQLMFKKYLIDSITNGVHAVTWTGRPFQELFDKHIPGWRLDNFSLRYAMNIPKEEIWQAHQRSKKELIAYVNRHSGTVMDEDTLTLGFGRRATAYKRADLLLRNPEELERIVAGYPGVQVVFAGKAHPQDQGGKDIIRTLFRAMKSMNGKIRMAYLENYDMNLGRLMTSGVDVWLNTPEPPLEASGTSGMKAALNGVPSLSVRDGWWLEGHIEGITGWSVEAGVQGDGDSRDDVQSLYGKLGDAILPLFYKDRGRYIDIMRHAVTLNGAFFNTQRMVQQYVTLAYFL